MACPAKWMILDGNVYTVEKSREGANAVHFDFWFCSHLQPLAQVATWQPLVTQASKFQHCTLSSLCKTVIKSSSSLALQKFELYSRKSLGLFHDFSARSSGENRNFFAEQHCRNLGFLQNCVWRNHYILDRSSSHLQPLASGCKWLQNGKSKCAPPASSMEKS